MTSQASIILWLSPLVIGAIVAAANSDKVNEATEKAEAWLKRAYAKSAAKKSWFFKFILQPLLWVVVKFSDWTDSLPHRGLKNGLRIASAFYFVILWGSILVYAIWLLLMIGMVILILYVVFKMLLSNPEVRQGYEAGQRIIGSTEPDTRVNPETGVIQKKGFFGWEDTDERIDPESGRYQERGFLGWDDTDTRVNPESGVIQARGFLGYDDTDTRIHPETGVIQKRGTFGWDDTDERIHPETGRHQKMGIFGWEDT